MNYPKCYSPKSVKSGHHLEKQRYKCKECECQFTREDSKGKSKELKALAIVLCLSCRPIAKTINISHKTVYDWVKTFGVQTYKKLKPEGTIIIELDEIWHFAK